MRKKLLYPKFYPVLSIALFMFFSNTLNGQGCVAVRPMGCAAMGNTKNLGLFEKGTWQFSANYRYFKSYRHFRGDVEEKERVELGTEVINIVHSIEPGISYGITNRISASVYLPFIYNDRSSLYEHYGNSTTSNPDQMRFHTGSQGIGDLRVGGNFWIFNPVKDSLNGNVSVGVGVKAPTGNSNIIDDFHKRNSEGMDSITQRPVDQSIQLGDRGWGIIFESQSFYNFSMRSSVYCNLFYLSNPESVNNTLTRGTLPITNIDSLTGYHSIADQYSARIGFNYNVIKNTGFNASLGGRIEGIPSGDLIGDSKGFRRPGYIVSVEPGVSYALGNVNITLNVPVAVYRNRTKSYSDIEKDKLDPSEDHHGDAAFSDYLINLNIIYSFGGKHAAHVKM